MKLTTKLVFMLLMIVSVFISCDLETTQYTVTFDSNDGSSIENQIISKNGKIQKPNDPTYSGNVFMGWYEDTDFEFRYNFNDRVDEDMTLYAKWVDGIAVSFDTGEGSNVATVDLLNANRLTRPQDPTLQGFTFSGWYKDTDFRFLYNFDDRVDEDMTLYAKWLRGWTITFDTDEGSDIPNVGVLDGNSLALPQEPTKAGYTFVGWITDPNTNDRYDFTSPVTGDFKLYALWTNSRYQVYFDWNNDTDEEEYPGDHTILNVTYGLPMPSAYINTVRVGYTFKGVGDLESYDDYVNDYSNYYYWRNMDSARIWDKTAEDSVLYGVWSPNMYEVTLVDGCDSIDIDVYYEKPMPSGNSAPTKSGYSFNGYYDEETGGTKYYDENMGSARAWDKPEDDTLYAQWTLNNYDISYELYDGINDGSNPSTYSITSSDITLANPTKTGYTFEGWFTESEFTNSITKIESGSIDDVNVYAKWDLITYNITYTLYDGTNGSGNPNSYTIEDDSISLEDPERNGFRFDGWYLNSSFTGTEITTIDTSDTEDITLYAKWIQVFTVSFVDNDEDNETSLESEIVDAGESATEPTDPTRLGYSFDGWYSDSALTNSYSFINDVISNITLYAKWDLITYNITYTLYDGRNCGGNPNSYTIEDSEITFTNPTKTGYTFGGWYTESGFTNSITTIASGSTEDVDVYAKWDLITYNITYTLYDGTNGSGNPNSYTIEDSEITFTNPTKTGYTFEGWFTESSFTNSITKIELGSTGDVDVYAQWIAKTTSISFYFQGGQDGSNEVSATFGSAMPSGINAPASDNYNFLGYFDRSSGGNQYYDKDMNSAKNWDKEGITGILFAQWEPKTYTITFDPNNGTGGPAPVQAVTNQYLPYLTYPGDIPTRVSYDFMGYEDSMGTSYYNETLTPILTWRAAEDFTLYARWAVVM